MSERAQGVLVGGFIVIVVMLATLMVFKLLGV